jgi:hypothetical protein
VDFSFTGRGNLAVINSAAGSCWRAPGVLCGLAYSGFFGQIWRIQHGEPDPAPIPSLWVAVIKGVGFALAILALILTLRGSNQTVSGTHRVK